MNSTDIIEYKGKNHTLQNVLFMLYTDWYNSPSTNGDVLLQAIQDNTALSESHCVDWAIEVRPPDYKEWKETEFGQNYTARSKRTIHIVLTDDLAEDMPDTCEVIKDWGSIQVRFPLEEGVLYKRGLHCFVQGEAEDLREWLIHHILIIQGNGTPQLEQFNLTYTKTL